MLQAVAGRLPPKPEEVEKSLQDALTAEIFHSLPFDVVEHLIEAETYFNSRTEKSKSKLGLTVALELLLDNLFIEPVQSYYKNHRLQWDFRNHRGYPLTSHDLLDCGKLFCKLAGPQFQATKNVNVPGISQFLKEHCRAFNITHLNELGELLQKAQLQRGASSHGQREYLLEKERRQLEELRQMILGLNGRPSIIRQMVELFGTERDTA